MSPRKGGPFLGVNCAALSESLLESELFGHERGAFTGAEKLRKGRFELADGGTLLLDEISEVSTKIQAKLLRVLQERMFERVGSSVAIGADVRVIATSNIDLPRAVAKGAFRQDLFFRLNVLPIHLPPLRDRLEDVPELAGHFVAQIARREGRPDVKLDVAAMQALCRYDWPGNVRELQNICERAVVLSRSPLIGPDVLQPWLVGSPVGDLAGNGAVAGLGTSLPRAFAEAKPGAAEEQMLVPVWGRALEDIEREAIVKTLLRFNGHRQRTAHALGIGVRTLGLKLKKWKELSLVEPTL
jgi:two-component system, NtrC family, response regulator HydG